MKQLNINLNESIYVEMAFLNLTKTTICDFHNCDMIQQLNEESIFNEFATKEI